MAAPAKILTPCQGDGVLAVVRLGDYRTGEPPVVVAYETCPGCPDCARPALAPSTPQSQAAAFARIPAAPIDKEF